MFLPLTDAQNPEGARIRARLEKLKSGSAPFQWGRGTANLAGIAQALLEISSGFGSTGGGMALTSTGVGAPVGAVAMAAGYAQILHGAAVGGASVQDLSNLISYVFRSDNSGSGSTGSSGTGSTGGGGSSSSKPLTSFTDVANYIKKHGKLPTNFITKAQAKALGWNPKKGNLAQVAPGKSIGGDIFKNNEGKLPNAPGRIWYEADINYVSGSRGADRILFSNDGFIFKTSDHYSSFTQIK